MYNLKSNEMIICENNLVINYSTKLDTYFIIYNNKLVRNDSVKVILYYIYNGIKLSKSSTYNIMLEKAEYSQIDDTVVYKNLLVDLDIDKFNNAIVNNSTEFDNVLKAFNNYYKSHEDVNKKLEILNKNEIDINKFVIDKIKHDIIF